MNGQSGRQGRRWPPAFGAVAAARAQAARHRGESGFALAVAYAGVSSWAQQPIADWRFVRVMIDDAPAVNLSGSAIDGWVAAVPGPHHIVVRPRHEECVLFEVTLNAVQGRPSVLVLYPVRHRSFFGVTRAGYKVCSS